MKALIIHESVELRTFCTGNARSAFSMSSFFAINDFYIMNTASMDFLLDGIYIKRPRGLYITLF